MVIQRRFALCDPCGPRRLVASFGCAGNSSGVTISDCNIVNNGRNGTGGNISAAKTGFQDSIWSKAKRLFTVGGGGCRRGIVRDASGVRSVMTQEIDKLSLYLDAAPERPR